MLAVGKRLSDKIYLEYGHSVSTLCNVVRVNYLLTRDMSLRLETGTGSGVRINFGRAFE